MRRYVTRELRIVDEESEHNTQWRKSERKNQLCARSCASLSSLRASSSIFFDSVRFRNTSVGCNPPREELEVSPNKQCWPPTVYAAHVGQDSENLSDAKETTPCSIVAQQGALYAQSRRLLEIPHFVPILLRRGVRGRQAWSCSRRCECPTRQRRQYVPCTLHGYRDWSGRRRKGSRAMTQRLRDRSRRRLPGSAHMRKLRMFYCTGS